MDTLKLTPETITDYSYEQADDSKLL